MFETVCKHAERQRGSVCGLERGEQRYNLCLRVQAGWLTACISQGRPAHSEIYWHALIKTPAEERNASTHLRRTLEPEGGNGHKVIVPPRPRDRSSIEIQHRCAEMPLHKCLLTVKRKDGGNRLFKRQRTVRLESFHSMSYYRNKIQECVLRGDYCCDSDAVDVRRRWGLLVIIAVLQQA